MVLMDLHELSRAVRENSVVLKLQVETFLGVTYQISCILVMYIMIHNTSKIRYEIATM